MLLSLDSINYEPYYLTHLSFS